MDIRVRPAEENDIANLLPLTRALHYASFRKDYSDWNVLKWANWLKNCIENDVMMCLMATDEVDLPLGFITAVVFPAYWDNDIISCNETGMWVVPEHRHNGIGTALINGINDWAKDKKCTTLIVGASQAMEPKKTSIWYKKMGFELNERYFARRI